MASSHPHERRKFLHIGCGRNDRQKTTTVFLDPEWQEVRLDVNPAVKPDIVASFLDLSSLSPGGFNAAFLSHVIEHVYRHEVIVGLKEIARVLTDDGFIILRCPDLQGACEIVAAGNLLNTIYTSSGSGPINPHDLIFGHTRYLARGHHTMAHRSGHTAATLTTDLTQAGFSSALIMRCQFEGLYLELCTIATKKEIAAKNLEEMLRSHFPTL